MIKILEGKTFFFMGLSNRWGTEERTILKDCVIAQNAGAKVYLYTYKDSVLDERARAHGLECLYHQGKFVTKVFKWHKLRKLKNLLADLQVNVVHCYDIKVLWPLCLYMRSMPLVPLVFTLSNDLKKYFRSFWYRPLVSRVDQVLLPMSEMMENVWGHMGIPPRKIDFIGLGLKSLKKESDERPPFRFTEKRWYIGTNLNGIETNTHFLDTVFHSFRVMIEKGLDEKNYTFALCNERNWSECVLTDELRRQVKDWGLEEHVAFVDQKDVARHQLDIDLWLGLTRREEIEDYAVQALLAGKPICVPRTASSMEIFRTFGVIGESYMSGDSREIREKCELILRNYETYEKGLHKSHQALRSTYGHESYEESLTKIYDKLLNRRRRLWRVRQRRKLVPSKLLK
jgi:glycosyltransferase involved in cell wall biosynthesis